MKIGIIDADLLSRRKHRFPNLACMKISGYYKELGHEVTLILNWDFDFTEYDSIFLSKVFTDTDVPEKVLDLPNIEFGGTGFFYDKAPPLKPEIEHHKPDYHLYDDFVMRMRMTPGVTAASLKYYTDYSLGFTTRGCVRGCSFCVNKNYTSCKLHSPIHEFLDEDRKYICLLDDNVLACKNWKEVFDQLRATGKRCQFKQGLDERLLTEEKCQEIFSLPWKDDYIFAFDNLVDRPIIEPKLAMLRSYTDTNPKFYVFCGYNHYAPGLYDEMFWAEDIRGIFERIKILMTHKCVPYIMRYKDYELSPYKGMYINLARWCNQPSLFKKLSFREFCYYPGMGTSAIRYLEHFEEHYPDIAERYFDMKWEDFK